jgi:serine/threonine protein kinase
MAVTRGRHLIGKVLGSCVLERLLGYGGSSAVFLAQPRNSERKVAVKVFLPPANMDVKMRRDFYQRFLREAEAARQLDHPNILPIYAYGEQDGLPYIVMPYMEGGTLSEYVARNGSLSLQDARWYLEQITSALDYAHQHRHVHCDIKPANILLDSEGHVMLSDFGITRVVRENVGDEQPGNDQPAALMGTPDYISPEQAMGHPLDGRSDIYSLGVTLFYLLAKQLPFKADTTIALALLHLHEAPPSLALIRPDITLAIDQVVHKALAKEPGQRFQTAGEFSAAFAQAVTEAEMQPISGKQQSVLISNPGHVSNPHPAVAVSEPGKPLGRQIGLLRLVAVFALVISLFITGLLSTNYLLTHLASSKPVQPAHQQTLLASGVSENSDDQLSDQSDWPVSGTFFFDSQQQRYLILNKSRNLGALAIFQNHEFGDFDLTVTMSEVHSPKTGADNYGVVFRCSSDQSRYYLFEVLSSSSQGQYAFLRYDRNTWVTLATGTAPSLRVQSGKNNMLTIHAHGNRFTFAINGEVVGGTFSDPSKTPLKSGQVGLYVEDENAEVAFSHLYITPANNRDR